MSLVISQVMAEAEAEFGWTLVSASCTLHTLVAINILINLAYVGIQKGPKHAIIGSLLPLATNDDLQVWKSFLQRKKMERRGY